MSLASGRKPGLLIRVALTVVSIAITVVAGHTAEPGCRRRAAPMLTPKKTWTKVKPLPEFISYQ